MKNEKIVETQHAEVIGNAVETSECFFCGTTYNLFEGHLCENPVGFRAIKCGRCAELEKQIESLYSWRGLITILDKVYPEWLFTSDGVKITEENWQAGDIGAVVVRMIRLMDEAEKEIESLKSELESEKRKAHGRRIKHGGR